MALGKAKQQRQSLVQQASLVWSQESAERLQNFIEHGTFTGTPNNVEPYNQAELKNLLGIRG